MKMETQLDFAATREALHTTMSDLRKEMRVQTRRPVTFVCVFEAALVAVTFAIAGTFTDPSCNLLRTRHSAGLIACRSCQSHPVCSSLRIAPNLNPRHLKNKLGPTQLTLPDR